MKLNPKEKMEIEILISIIEKIIGNITYFNINDRILLFSLLLGDDDDWKITLGNNMSCVNDNLIKEGIIPHNVLNKPTPIDITDKPKKV